MQPNNTCPVEVFSGSWYSSPCGKKAGFGKDGLYCKQHAETRPSSDQPTTTAWVVSQKTLTRVQVYGVTPKTFLINSAEDIIGESYMSPGRYSRDRLELFSDEAEAAQRLVDIAAAHYEICRKRLNDADRDLFKAREYKKHLEERVKP